MESTTSYLLRRRKEIRRKGAAVPFTFENLESEALSTLSEKSKKFVSGGAGSGTTAASNRTQFDRWSIYPRVFRDVSSRSLETELLGMTLPAPVLLAPVGLQTMYAEEGELASARAASSLDIPFTLSTAASQSIEAVAEEQQHGRNLFQLYWTNDWDVTASLISRAERAGYEAIVLTIDYQVSRWMPETIEQSEIGERKFANLETDPATDDTKERRRISRDQTVTWDDLSFIQDRTDLPVVVKGICHPEDAELAVEYGANAVLVSNHGGRQIDGAVSAIRALPDVVDVIDGRIPVLFDSGIRNGSDVFKAIALGADAVLMGRAYIYGLAIAGERGVYEVIHNVLAELESILGLAGHNDINDVDRSSLLRCVS